MPDIEQTEPQISGAKHIVSRLMAQSLMNREVLLQTDRQPTLALLPDVSVVKVGGQSIMDRGRSGLLPVLEELGQLSSQHKLLITAGEGTRARHVYHIASDLGLPTGLLSILGNLVSEQNALIITSLMMRYGAVRVPVAHGTLPVVRAAAAYRSTSRASY